MPSDEELYAAWTAGDRRAGSDLVDRYVRAIGRFFANKLAAEHDVEDATSRAFEVCTRNLGSFRGEGSFRSYLFGIAYNVLRETWRRRRDAPIDFEHSAVRDLAPSPASAVQARTEANLLLAALRAIPLDLQTVIELSYFEGLSRTEVAEVLAVPPGTVASRLRRAHRLLEAAIDRLATTPDLARTTRTDLARWAEKVRAKLGRASAGDDEDAP